MDEPLRIAYLISRYPAVNHTFILREITGLRDLGLDVGVIAIRGADRPPEGLTEVERREQAQTDVVLPFGVHFIRAHAATLIRRPAGYAAGLILALQLGARNPRAAIFHMIYFLEAVVAGHIAESRGYRHLHTHFSSTVALIAQRVFGFGFSMTIHGPDEFRDVEAFAMRRKVAGARFVSTISNFARSQVMLACDPADWHKIEVNRLGVDPDVFRPAQVSEKAEYSIACVGRLAPVKAQRILIEACSRLIRTGWSLRLHLAGAGPDADALRAAAQSAGIADHVAFEGALNQPEIIQLYHRSDVFVLASFAEGVPVVLMEAMACEVPCVATWVNGVPELIRDGEEGLLVSPADPGALAEAVQLLLRDSGLRRRIAQAGRRRILAEYHLRNNVQALGDLFRRYLGASQRSEATLSR